VSQSMPGVIFIGKHDVPLNIQYGALSSQTKQRFLVLSLVLPML
jgi:hypothetical protein